MRRHRVSLTLSEEEYEVLKLFSEAAKTTPTRIIHNLYQEVMPSFKTVNDAIKSAEFSKHDALSKIQTMLLNHLHEASGVSREIQKELNQ